MLICIAGDFVFFRMIKKLNLYNKQLLRKKATLKSIYSENINP